MDFEFCLVNISFLRVLASIFLCVPEVFILENVKSTEKCEQYNKHLHTLNLDLLIDKILPPLLTCTLSLRVHACVYISPHLNYFRVSHR